MTRQEIVEFFARRDPAWQRHDVAALAADHTEDGEVDSPLWGKIKDRAAIQNVYAQWFSSFPDAEYVAEHLLIDGIGRRSSSGWPEPRKAISAASLLPESGSICAAPSCFALRMAGLRTKHGSTISRES